MGVEHWAHQSFLDLLLTVQILVRFHSEYLVLVVQHLVAVSALP